MATQTVSHVVPQSKSAVVVPIPQPSPAPITQEELEEVILLRNALKQRQEQLAWIETQLKSRLEAGAAVEEGTHIADLKEAFRRNVAWREVAERLGDRLYGEGQGEGYCQRVLAATKPARTVSLHVQ
jgi:hypothetical protein